MTPVNTEENETNKVPSTVFLSNTTAAMKSTKADEASLVKGSLKSRTYLFLSQKEGKCQSETIKASF